MKYQPIHHLATTVVGTLIALGTVTLHGGEQEIIVGEQIVSDSVAEGATSDSDSGVYVGDISAEATGVSFPRQYGQPDLFYNYYTQGNANGTNAQMYLSPGPIPPNVGHTFFTYQPFYPHEMMYWHTNRFHRSYDNGRGMNRTRAVYYSPPIRQAASNFYWNYLRLPR